MRLRHVDSIEEHRQLGRCQWHVTGLGVGHREGALFEAFANQHVAIGLPQKDGEPVATLVSKDEQIARERITLECGGHNRSQGVVAFTSIDGLHRNEDACPMSECQHVLTAVMNRVTSDTSVSMGSLTTMPLGKFSSTMVGVTGRVTGTNRWGDGGVSVSLS